MEQKPSYTLGKAERLKRRKQIEELFTGGRSFTAYPVKVYYRLAEMDEANNEVSKVLVGVSASKRHFKKAVDRNRVKRLLREVYRLNKLPLQEKAAAGQKQLQVFFIYVDKTLPTFAVLDEKMAYSLKRLMKILEDGSK